MFSLLIWKILKNYIVEKIHWNTSEEIFIDDNELDCLDVCYVIHDSTLSDEAAYELKNAFKLFEFENK